MAQKDNILPELKELNSTLVNLNREPVFSVPSGYFDGLIAEVMKRIRAIEALNAGEELSHLSPAFSGWDKKIPFTVPQNYFDGLAERMLMLVHSTNQTAKEELESLSPLLSGMKKEIPYTLPQGYFEQLAGTITTKENAPAKVVAFGRRKWLSIAAAAVIAGTIIFGGISYFGSANRINPVEQPYAWVKKSVKKVNSTDLDSFVKLVDEALPGQQDVAVNPVPIREVKELMKDVSDKEIEEFLENTPDTENSSSDDEAIVN